MTAGIHDVWPLSPFQAGMLFLAGDTAADADGWRPYVGQTVVDLRDGIDPDRLAGAYRELVATHRLLGARFRQLSDGTPVAVLTDDPPVDWTVLDLGMADDPDMALAEARTAQRMAGFDLAAGPAIRALLALPPSGGASLTLTNHHILLDARATDVLIEDLMARYAGLPVAAASYADYLAHLARRDPEQDLRYWRTELGDLPTGTWLTTTGRARGPGRATHVHHLDRASRTALHEVDRAGGSAEAVLLAALGPALSAHLDGGDVIVGLLVSDRNSVAGADRIVGPALNTVPVRLPGTGPAEEVLRTVRTRRFEAVAHCAVSVADIESRLRIGPLFDVAVVPALTAPPPPPGVTGVHTRDHTHYPLAFELDPRAGVVRVVRDPMVVPESTVDFVLAGLDAALRPLLRAGGEPVRPLTRPWSTLDGLVRRHVVSSPTAPAVQDGADRIDYATLDRRVDQLAAQLLARGVARGGHVALRLPRCAALVVATLAVSRIGAVFAPLSPSLPRDRFRTIVDRLAPAAVVTLEPDAANPGPTVLVHRDGSPRAPHVAAAVPPVTGVGRDDPAYIVFTSGSSGTPKGVLVPNAGLAALAATQAGAAPTGPGDRVLQFSSVGFDVVIWELLWSLAAGAELVVVPDRERMGVELAEFIRREGLTHCAVPPAIVATWPEDTVLPAGLTLAVGTEAMPRSVVRTWGVRHRVINAYGPSEATVNSALWVCDPDRPDGGPVPIGRPDPGTSVVLVDERLVPVAPGERGEVLLGGEGIATGYLGAVTAAEAARFTRDEAGRRRFRTGDIARWAADGLLEFHGRADDQVQVRGVRVEPAEVETVLARCVDGGQVAVIPVADEWSGTELVAFVVAPGHRDSSRSDTVGSWLAKAAELLPAQAVPTRVELLDALPRTDRDKVDRTRLAALVTPRRRPPRTGATTEPSTSDPMVDRMGRLFEEVLGVPRVGPDDNLFALGGNSLLVLRLAGVLRARLGVPVPVATVLGAPTPRALAGRLSATHPTDHEAGPVSPAPVRTGPPAKPVPLDEDQLDIYLHHRVDPLSTAYTIAFSITVRGDVDPRRLVDAVQAAAARHPALGMVLTERDGSVLPRPAGPPPVRRISGADDSWTLDALAAEPFDLGVDRPARLHVIEHGPRSAEVVCVLHHVAADHESVRLLAEDTALAYRRGPDHLPPGPTARGYTTSRAGDVVQYWRRRLADLDPRPLLPSAPASRDTCAVVRRGLGSAVIDAVDLQARHSRTSRFVVLAAAVVTVLADLSGRSRVLVGSAVSGRVDSGPAGVGNLVGTGLLDCELAEACTPADLIAVVDRARTVMLDWSPVSGGELRRIMPGERTPGRLPVEVFVNHLPGGAVRTDFGPGVTSEVRLAAARDAKFPLAIDLVDEPESGTVTIVCAVDDAVLAPARAGEILDRISATVAVLSGGPGPLRGHPAPWWPEPATPHATEAPDQPHHAVDELATRFATTFGEVLDLPSFGADDDFFRHGGQSLRAMRLVAALRERHSRTVAIQALFDAGTPRALAARVLGARRGVDRAGADRAAVDRERDARLPLPPIHPASGGPVLNRPLLTGATGFLGSHLLAALLDAGAATVVCPVRADSASAATDRLADSLRDYGLWTPERMARVIALPADLALPRLGWSDGAYREVGATTTGVVHAGAHVHHLETYAVLRAPNVLGTRDVLGLAGAGVPVHVASSLGFVVAGEAKTSGYDQSKQVADTMVTRAAAAGRPATAHRLGHLGGASTGGPLPPQDWVSQLLRACVAVGAVPASLSPVGLLPVDVAADGIVADLLRPDDPPPVRDWPEPVLVGVTELRAALLDAGFGPLSILEGAGWASAVHALDSDLVGPLVTAHPLPADAAAPVDALDPDQRRYLVDSVRRTLSRTP